MNRPRPAGRRRPAAALLVAAGVAAALLGAGCSAGVGTLSFPDPPPVTAGSPPVPAATLPAGLAAMSEAPVDGVTTTTAPAVGPGPASLTGTVLGPGGPVRGAVVEADRLVGDAVAATRTTTAADGSWSLNGILGGRYRVRAWHSPDLDLVSPQIVFLAAAQPQSLTLHLTAYPGPQVTVAVNPPAPVAGQPANLVVQVVNPSVGPDGVLDYKPVTGSPVSLVDGPAWQIASPNPATTDGAGQALFSVVCSSPGPDPLGAQVAGANPVVLQVPACAAPPATSPPTTPGYPGAPGSTTSTTCPSTGSPSSTDPNATTTTLLFGNCQ